MKAGMQVSIDQENWKGAAQDAGNLSELHMANGDVSQSLAYARQSVEFADRSGDAGQRMINRTTLADALHQSGNLQEAEKKFREAEGMQKEYQPSYPFLYSLRGSQYCDLLLAQGKREEVQDRVAQTLEWTEQQLGLLSIALDHLSLGRAHLLQAQEDGTGDFSRAEDELNQAVDGLLAAGDQMYLPRGLLARAELHRVRKDYDRARQDLDEAMSITTRGGMRLHQADCHLEYARLYLAMDKKDKARESLDVAREMVDEMGYGRREREISDFGF